MLLLGVHGACVVRIPLRFLTTRKAVQSLIREVNKVRMSEAASAMLTGTRYHNIMQRQCLHSQGGWTGLKQTITGKNQEQAGTLVQI